MPELTPKRRRFVQEYLKDLNGTQAAIRAGYSKRTANEQAADLLAVPSVKAAVVALQKAREARTGVTADRVLVELARVAFGDIRGLFDEAGHLRPVHELEVEVAAMLSGIEVLREKTVTNEIAVTQESVVKVKSWDKVRALELLAKHLGMLRERVEVEGTVNLTLKDADTRLAGKLARLAASRPSSVFSQPG